MLSSLALALVTLIFPPQRPPSCVPGQVLEVNRGQDFTICGVGEVGLRGVEPPLRTAEYFGYFDGNPARRFSVGGEILGNKDIGPEALKFLSDFTINEAVVARICPLTNRCSTRSTLLPILKPFGSFLA